MKFNQFVLIGLITLLLITSVSALPSWLDFYKKVKQEHENTKRGYHSFFFHYNISDIYSRYIIRKLL